VAKQYNHVHDYVLSASFSSPVVVPVFSSFLPCHSSNTFSGYFFATLYEIMALFFGSTTCCPSPCLTLLLLRITTLREREKEKKKVFLGISEIFFSLSVAGIAVEKQG
jgi:hypothetical protein